jgi:beta-lactamase class A
LKKEIFFVNIRLIVKNEFMKKRTVFFGVILLLVGGLIGYFVGVNSNNSADDNNNNNNNFELHAGGYKLINPLYECGNSEVAGAKEFSSLESKLNDTIDDYISDGKVISASMYFRDLNNGPWFGVNEKVDFSPSSLLKLPVMLAYYKMAESDPDILDKVIKFDKDHEGVLQQNYPANDPLQKGKSYTVEQLIERMIIYSDNAALGALYDNISPERVDKVTLDLGIPTATDSTPEDFMNVKDYSALFRVLFNASYLSKDLSEKTLGILTQSDFGLGLRKQVPQNIQIAHKFGERDLSNGIKQLHDCGIVYYPQHPYLICVMTRGTRFEDLESVIQEISGRVYKAIDYRYNMSK